MPTPAAAARARATKNLFLELMNPARGTGKNINNSWKKGIALFYLKSTCELAGGTALRTKVVQE
jgi:hypothetical protein